MGKRGNVRLSLWTWQLFFPYMWGIMTRHITVQNKVSFFLIDIFPSAFFFYSLAGVSVSSLIRFLLAYTLFYSLYEFGYMENDVVTVRDEQVPSYRLNKKQQDWAGIHIQFLLISRLVTAGIMGMALVRYYTIPAALPLEWMVALLLMYHAHNKVRGRGNLFTMWGLGTIKYLMPIICALGSFPYFGLGVSYFSCFICLILPHVIEYGEDKGYLFKLSRNRDSFRVIYMVIVAMGIGGLVFASYLPIIALYFTGIFLLYRGLGWLVRNKEKLSYNEKKY